MKKIVEQIKNDEIIKKITSIAQATEIYLVGGAIRDFYFGRKNIDKDIVVKTENVEAFARDLAQKLDGTFIQLDEENEIYRIVLDDKINCIDLATMVGNDIESDLKRRDFSINSIALDLKTFKIIDINNGIDDLEKKLIRHLNEQNFVDDPLRLLRAFRFEAMLGFELDAELVEIIRKHASKIHSCSIERVSYELLKLFAGDFTEKSLLNMDKTGLLQEILPISKELKLIPPNLHHHLNLFEHSIETVKQVQTIYKASTDVVQAHLEQYDFGGSTRLAHLKLAAFLHDIGKPQTWTIEEETGKHRFIKHDDVGSKMSISMLKKNKFSKKQINYISKLIKYHIYPSNVVAAPEINDKIYMRLIRKLENEVIDVILLAMADRLSARGVEITDEIINKNINGLLKLLDFYLNKKDDLEPLPKLLSGEEIMEILSIPPSKQLGEIIKTLKEAQISGEVTTREEAINFITPIAAQ